MSAIRMVIFRLRGTLCYSVVNEYKDTTLKTRCQVFGEISFNYFDS